MGSIAWVDNDDTCAKSIDSNVPRLIQHHLKLKYFDVSSGNFLSDQQYRSINAQQVTFRGHI